MYLKHAANGLADQRFSMETNLSASSAVAICPYCAAPLLKYPERKTKCPVCRQPIYARRTPASADKTLFREDQLGDLDLLWEAEAERKKQEERDAYSTRFGFPLGQTDIELGKLLLDAAKDYSRDLGKRKQALVNATYFLRRFMTLEDQKMATFLLATFDLLRMQETGFARAKLRGGSAPCKSCAEITGEIRDISELLSTDVVPNRQCEQWEKKGQCCAFWGAVLPR